jgi:hypothetical protein
MFEGLKARQDAGWIMRRCICVSDAFVSDARPAPTATALNTR